jgi:hypothetical protein
MKRNSLLWYLTLLMVIVLASCQAQPAVQPTVETAATDAALATQAVNLLAPTNTAEVATLEPTPEPTATLAPTATLEPTATTEVVVSPTSAPVVVSSGDIYITLAYNAICRIGPETNYQSVASFTAGTRLLAVGRFANDDIHYYIENPNSQDTYCWINGNDAVVEGNRATLSMVEPLPSPTPSTGYDFSLVYSTIKQCGDDYAFSFRVTNLDKKTWQSIKVVIVDAKTKTTASYTSDYFVESVDCHSDNIQSALSAGGHAYITPYNPGHFDYSPYGGSFLIRVTLCSENGMQGTCLTREVSARP